jgi:hypothetical protein
MIVKIYLKGKFRASYTGKWAGNNEELTRTYKAIEFNEIWLEEAEQIEAYDLKVLTKEPYYLLSELRNVFISFKNEKNNIFFQEDFNDVVINEIEISHPETNETKGELNGLFYGTYLLYKPDPISEIDIVRKVDKPKKQSNIITELEQEPSTFNQPWQPDEFLNNFNIKRTAWDGWRERWANNSVPLFLCLIAAFIFVGLAWLNYPILWIPFIIILKIIGDILMRIFLPNFTEAQMSSSKSPGKVRYVLRILYTFMLISITIYFLAKQLYLFSFLSGLLLLLHWLAYSSPMLYFLRRIFQGSAILLLLFFLLRFFEFQDDSRSLPLVTADNDAELIPDKQDSTVDGNKYTLTWYDYHDEEYTGTFEITTKNYSTSNINRKNQPSSSSFDTLYSRCHNIDKNLISEMIIMFDKIQNERKLDSKRFAEMIGSFIQRIPYVLVHEESCAKIMELFPNDEFIQQYHLEGKQCLQNCKFGFQAPTEFGYNLQGDCDTRALMAFTILDHYGYDVAILISEVYGHAVLGIGLPYQGVYKSNGGVRYYAWELTAMNWQPGLLSPQVGDMDNWEIMLTNK